MKHLRFSALLYASLALVAAATGQVATNVVALRALEDEFRRDELRQRLLVFQYSQRTGEPIRREYPDGTIVEMMGIDESGFPYYYVTHNRNAAISTATFPCFPGQASGLNLTGQGVTLGIWDGGAVLTTHQEIVGRAVIVDGASLSSHAAHVSGTMIASGVDPTAIGMSTAGLLRSFNWTNDTSEMASEAGAGLRVSNHSYGTITGWRSSSGTWYWYGNTNLSQTEDANFGFYNSTSRNWDTIAFNAPFYLIVKSAGNDRGEGPSNQPVTHYVRSGNNWVTSTTVRDRDGGANGYDCMSAASVAKNILTVGAVNDVIGGYSGPGSVTMSSFSSWGPTDDGRIKPDIVANGVSLRSIDSAGNNRYRNASGTSMSAPNASGSLGLLIEQWRRYHPGDMRSATLKGLVIHTADETGSWAGPDYRFGWGLMNTRRAAETIAAHSGFQPMILERVLSTGQEFTFAVASDGTEPIRATLCWTDRPGTPVAAALNPRDPMLVNDLDLRIQAVNWTFMPFVMDVENPASPPTLGDNSVDNVEQVRINAPQPGIYLITVSHKGSLVGGAQAFSLIVTGHRPYEMATGTIQFAGLAAGAAPPASVQFELRRPGETQPVETFMASVNSQGNFVLPVLGADQEISLQVGSWLRRTIQADATQGGLSGLVVNLVNGDVDGNNVIDIRDFIALRQAMGSSLGDSNWNPAADLDRDGSVGVQDFLILRSNFGMVGDD